MGLVSVAEAKTHLNIPSGTTTFDTELGVFVDVASALVEGYADRVFALTTSSQLFDGGGDVFLLRVSPVTGVTGVTVDGTALGSDTYEADIAKGIVKTNGTTAEGTANVSVAYTAGSATIPPLAKHATLETVRHLWATQRGSMGGRNPLNGDDYVAGMSFSMPRRVMELLDPLRNVN